MIRLVRRLFRIFKQPRTFVRPEHFYWHEVPKPFLPVRLENGRLSSLRKPLYRRRRNSTWFYTQDPGS